MLFTSVGGEGSESHEGATLDAVVQGRSELSPSLSLGVGVAQKSCLQLQSGNMQAPLVGESLRECTC